MELKRLNDRPEVKANSKTAAYILQMNNFLDLLKDKKINKEVISRFNEKLDRLNNVQGDEKRLKKELRKTQSEMLQILMKEEKLVCKSYYRNTWMMLGMGAIGVPIGTAIGVSSGNMGLIGMGLPLGMAIGVVAGLRLDKKAKDNGNQLDIEIKY